MDRGNDSLTREYVVEQAGLLGWRPWGKLRPYGNGSRYQGFRRRNQYCWIGAAFVERQGYPFAIDFRYEGARALELLARET